MILKEQHFEDILCKYPELIEDGLIFLKRQVKVHNKRIDILFEDKFKRNLLVELKSGVIKDDHIGQLLGYEGFLLSADDPTIRIMLIGNRVPPNLQSSLDHHGIAWREFSYSMLKNFLEAKRDFDLLKYFEDFELPDVKKDMKVIETANKVEKTKLIFLSIEQKVDQMKSCEAYIKFGNVINKKEANENEAKKILQNNFGNLTINHL
ncbi:endonuclease NucS, partial [candidate division KSB1 bacterium]|nr:endonuclease NucS [candidate division KSB1 bacterium]